MKWARQRRIKRYIRRELRSMGITPPLRVDTLCRRLGERRSRRIRLVPYPLPRDYPYGLWFAYPEGDFIVYQSETSRQHQILIILHELAHIMAGHGSDEQDEQVWDEWVTDLTPRTVRMMRRTHYDEEHEQEAELVASIVQEWASVLEHSSPRVDTDDPMVRQIQAALDDRQGWL